MYSSHNITHMIKEVSIYLYLIGWRRRNQLLVSFVVDGGISNTNNTVYYNPYPGSGPRPQPDMSRPKYGPHDGLHKNAQKSVHVRVWSGMVWTCLTLNARRTHEELPKIFERTNVSGAVWACLPWVWLLNVCRSSNIHKLHWGHSSWCRVTKIEWY